MTTFTFIPADLATHRDALIDLDSAPFMQSAHRMYEQFGFVDRGAYEEVEAPEAFRPILRFMEKSLIEN